VKSFNPYYIFDYFIRNKGPGFESLGGILLAVTGVEALYADLGHFNRISIQLSFPCIIYPALIVAYLGQGARVILDNSIVDNTFWNTVPKNIFIYWITFVLATLATIIASQAMISATFSLIHQAMQLDSFPRVKVCFLNDNHHSLNFNLEIDCFHPFTIKQIIHTSKKVEGQIYIPEVIINTKSKI